MNLPKVSAYCATYGRPKVLEEAVESFLKQDYKGKKELIILNDFGDHEIYFNHPEVKIYNLKSKICPLGKKFNDTVNLCSGEILFAWEDDDIYLPHRISFTVKKMLESGKKLFHTRRGFVESDYQKIVSAISYWGAFPLFHSNLAVYKSSFEEAGCYLETDQLNLDQLMINKLFEQEKYNSEKIEMNDFFYIYRINTNSYHATNFSQQQNAISKPAEEYVRSKNQIFGKYELKPHWKYNYQKYLEKKLNQKSRAFRLVF